MISIQMESRIGSKGVHGVKDFARRDGFTSHHSSSAELNSKPWKKHKNGKKKEKLRRLNRHLDVHT